MKIITVSREFGSGGRELAKRLADILGFDYYDKEIISAIAGKQGLDEQYVEKMFDNHAWRTFPLTFRSTFTNPAVFQMPQTNILAEQKRVIEDIAKAGKDCIIVGRNADIYLNDYNPFNIFVCADLDAKIKRCKERAKQGEILTDKEIIKQIKSIDKNRAKTREMITSRVWGESRNYNLTVNTTDWEIKNLATALAELYLRWNKGNL